MKKIISLGSNYFIVLVILFAVFSTMNSCSKSSLYGTTATGTPGGTGGPGANEVWIQGSAFNPSTITVAAGTTITWTNKDAVSHTVTSNTALFGSNLISPNGTYINMFSSVGTLPYHCNVHPSMTATVIVN
jgi:plastocyanin